MSRHVDSTICHCGLCQGHSLPWLVKAITEALAQAAADATLRERERCEAILNDELYDAERAEWRTPADRLTVRAWLLNARARIRQDAGAQSPEPELSSLHKIVEAPVVEPPSPEYARGVRDCIKLVKKFAVRKLIRIEKGDGIVSVDTADALRTLLPKAPGSQPDSARDTIMEVVNEQADDDGLWSVPLEGLQPIAEAYMQQELRRLHAVIERAYGVSAGTPKAPGGSDRG